MQEGGTGRWNRVCNRCHATHAQPRLHSMEEMDTHEYNVIVCRKAASTVDAAR